MSENDVKELAIRIYLQILRTPGRMSAETAAEQAWQQARVLALFK